MSTANISTCSWQRVACQTPYQKHGSSQSLMKTPVPKVNCRQQTLKSSLKASGTTTHSAFSSGVCSNFSRKSTLRNGQARSRVVDTRAENVCIINTNGGGHAVMGFYLAKELQTSGHSVTICVVGDESSNKMKKAPFTEFDQLRDCGVKTVWGNAPELELGNFDVVVDNNGKDLENVQPNVDWAKEMGAKQFIFVSSAGMYRPTNMLPITEEDPVKETAGHALVEQYVQGLEGIELSSFRPQYMMGHLNNKDCEEYFFDRVVRDRPVLVPGSGAIITNIASATDNATMIAKAVGNEAAYGQIFNCTRDKGVTLEGLVQLCAAAAGVEPKVVYYDAKALGVNAKKAFPFRTEYHFFTEPRKAMELLEWKPENDFFHDLLDRFEEYKNSDRFSEEMEFEMDDDILQRIADASE